MAERASSCLGVKSYEIRSAFCTWYHTDPRFSTTDPRFSMTDPRVSVQPSVQRGATRAARSLSVCVCVCVCVYLCVCVRLSHLARPARLGEAAVLEGGEGGPAHAPSLVVT
eukprot:1851813-Rhodomonas_salina.2